MRLEVIEKTLIELDPMEAIGKMHFHRYGKNLDTPQYLYLLSHVDEVHTPEELYLPEAVARIREVGENLRRKTADNLLRSDDFMRSGRSIEIEKLLRYVDIRPHKHEFFECAYVVSGKCVHQIDNVRYLQEAGSFVVIPPGYTHVLFPEDNSLCLTIKVRHKTIADLQIPGFINFLAALCFPCGKDDFVRHCIAGLWEQQEDALPYADEIMVQLFRTLLYYVMQRYREKLQYLVTSKIKDPMIVEILGYIMDHYRDVTLLSVADRFGYNPSYFSYLFRERIGEPFSVVLRKYRLEQAARILCEGKLPLNEVCDKIGYRDVSSFIKNFKEQYGVTPITYRNRKNLPPDPS